MMSASVTVPSVRKREFVCPVENCGRRFSRNHNLKTHLLSHHADLNPRQTFPQNFARMPSQTDYKVFKCPHPGCGRSYSMKNNATAHYHRTHLPGYIPKPVKRAQRGARLAAIEAKAMERIHSPSPEGDSALINSNDNLEKQSSNHVLHSHIDRQVEERAVPNLVTLHKTESSLPTRTNPTSLPSLSSLSLPLIYSTAHIPTSRNVGSSQVRITQGTFTQIPSFQEDTSNSFGIQPTRTHPQILEPISVPIIPQTGRIASYHGPSVIQATPTRIPYTSGFASQDLRFYFPQPTVLPRSFILQPSELPQVPQDSSKSAKFTFSF